MATVNEIKTKYLALHNVLGSRREAIDKELFDQQHGGIWHNCDVELQGRKAELGAKGILTLDEQKELAELESMFPTPREPGRNLATEFDDLKAKIGELERKITK